MDPAIMKAIGEYGISLVLAGITLYNYIVIIRSNAENLTKVTQLLEANGHLLESLSRSQDNTSASLDIIKTMLTDMSNKQNTTFEISETTLDKVMCLKEHAGLVGPAEHDKIVRRAKRGKK